MAIIVRKKDAITAIREAERLVSGTVIGVRTKSLVKIDEKHFNGVPRTFLSGKGSTVEKLIFLFGKSGAILEKRGNMEICVS